MAILSQVGVSEGEDAYTVGANACQDAMSRLDAERVDLVIVFASVKYDQEKMLAGVRSISKDALLVGSSTAGEISTEGPANKPSVAVMLIKSDQIRFYAAAGEGIKADARAAGKAAADKVKELAGAELKAFMMIPDVLVGNGADIVRGVLDSLGEHFPVVGGASGDDFKFVKTYQYL